MRPIDDILDPANDPVRAAAGFAALAESPTATITLDGVAYEFIVDADLQATVACEVARNPSSFPLLLYLTNGGVARPTVMSADIPALLAAIVSARRAQDLAYYDAHNS